MWHEGVIGIPDEADKEKYTACRFWVKAYKRGSQYGIDGGRISKLMIKVGDAVTANYDRGWDVRPSDEASQKALAILLHDYN